MPWIILHFVEPGFKMFQMIRLRPFRVEESVLLILIGFSPFSPFMGNENWGNVGDRMKCEVSRLSQVAGIQYFSNSSIYKMQMLYTSHLLTPLSSSRTDMVTMFTGNSWQMNMLIWEIVFTSLWGKKKKCLKSYWYMLPGILMPFATKQNGLFSNTCNLSQGLFIHLILGCLRRTRSEQWACLG